MTNNLGAARVNAWRVAGWGSAVALLLVPFVAMQFTREVRWSGFDFAVAAVLFTLVGLAIEFVMRRPADLAYRCGAGLAVVICLLLFWINGAVGIIGSEDNPANLMYAGVIAIAIGGSILARFRARGMAVTMVVAAAAHVVIAGVALAGQLGLDGRGWPRDVIGVTLIFVALWLVAAGLLGKAAHDRAETA